MRRCLINWEYESSGIWLLPGNPNACQPSLGGLPSPVLSADLERWNEWAERLFNGRVIELDKEQVVRSEAMKLDLAERAQDGLGEEWEVSTRTRARGPGYADRTLTANRAKGRQHSAG